ncbi:FKBP-type peptidyl-prolyl cis-trans isomerase [Polaribacter sp. Asnod1-A03]|uniref:FKBP-type peptidyl-prolyl cis-trans isomerase n=1 Tax=Polaribacter sp. Asnod1-A03 TaxID=3160581 RepID=UPI00386FF493
MKSYLLLFFSLILFNSCNSDDSNSFTQETEEDILQYITDNNLTASKTDSGLYYIINNEGTGATPTESSVVEIDYKGYFLDGSLFDEYDGAVLYLPQVINGFKEGLQLFKEGGDGTLIIPSELAYGDYGNGDVIPGGAVLIFDIKINNSYADYEEQNDVLILQYIEDNDLTATKTESGLYYVVNNEGTGTQPTSDSNVTVAYKGYLLDGTVFDESTDAGVSFNLSQLIAGFTEGVTYFKEGGEGTLLMPYTLGYGEYGSGSIPGFTVLAFDINLISVND